MVKNEGVVGKMLGNLGDGIEGILEILVDGLDWSSEDTDLFQSERLMRILFAMDAGKYYSINSLIESTGFDKGQVYRAVEKQLQDKGYIERNALRNILVFRCFGLGCDASVDSGEVVWLNSKPFCGKCAELVEINNKTNQNNSQPTVFYNLSGRGIEFKDKVCELVGGGGK